MLETAGRRFGFSLSWRNFDWSCETYLKTGRMMPEDGLEQLRPFDAMFLGAVGYPRRARPRFALGPADSDSPRVSAIRESSSSASCFAGMEPAVKNFEPGQIDFCVVRENTEGEYSEIGGRLYAKVPRMSWPFSKPFSPGAVATASCDMRSSWPARAGGM